MLRVSRFLPRSTAGRVVCAVLVASVSAAALGRRWALVTWKVREARAALTKSDIEAALSHLESAEELDPNHPEVLYLLGRAYRRNDQMKKVIPYLQRAGDEGWPEKDLRDQRFLTLVQVGRFDHAEAYLKKVLENGAEDDLAEEIYEALAKGYLKTYRLADALVCLKYWTQWKPQAVQPRLWLAEIWIRVDNHKSAASELRIAVEADPGHPVANRMLAKSLLATQQVTEAKRHFERCIEVAPNDWEAVIGLARCERRLSNAAAAKQHLEELLSRDVSDELRSEVLLELGQMQLVDARDAEGAAGTLQRAVALAPHNHEIHATLARAYRRTGKTELARSHEAKVKEIEESFNRLTEITRQLIRRPAEVDLRYEAGMIFMKQGLKKSGAEWLQTVLVFDRHHRDTRLALAKYCEETGDDKAAMEHRRLAAAQ